MYKETLISYKAKLNEDGTNCRLDLAFPIFHQEVVYKGVKYGPYPLPKSLDGETVLALVTYSDTERTVKLPDGTIVVAVPNSTEDVAKCLDKIADFQTDARVTANWTLTKADALATTSMVDDVQVVEKYDGIDKSDKYGFYPSACFEKAVAVEDIKAG